MTSIVNKKATTIIRNNNQNSYGCPVIWASNIGKNKMLTTNAELAARAITLTSEEYQLFRAINHRAC